MELQVDGEGFLKDRSIWTEEVMHELARMDGITLTDEQVEMIRSARVIFEEEQSVPPLRKFSKHHGGDRKGTHLNEMFNGAPMKKIAKWGALPKPTGCV